MNADEEKELAEVVLRTRRLAFRNALPEILEAVRRIVAGREAVRDERLRGADRMIRDYREIICRS
jgi:hypothetical protein